MSTQDNQNQPQQKRQKIKKACDNCRTRKIKCNGEQPCSKCSTTGIQCLYTYVEKKRVVKKKDNNNTKLSNNSIETLDNRMNKMESLISTLIEKLNGPSSLSGNSESISPDSKDTETNSNSSDVSIEASPEANIVENKDPIQVQSQQEDQGIAALCGGVKQDPKLPDEDKFIGSQSSLSVLSPRGVLWLSKKVNDPNLAKNFKNLIGRSHKVFYNYMKPWLEPIDSHQVAPLPPRELFNELLEYYNNELNHFTFTVPLEEMKSISEEYYKAKEGKPHKHLSNSDHLILHSAIALATTVRLEKYIDFPEEFSKTQILEQVHLKSAIFYFHRILMMGEGIKSLQGILLLVAHSNTSLIQHSNFMLISTAIRLGQTMGLHRVESFLNMSEDEKIKRRTIWWICYLLDRVNCLQGGKPITVSEPDMSTMDLNELKITLLKQYPANLLEKVISGEWDIMDPYVKQYFESNINSNSNVSVGPIISYFISSFFKFTSEAYDKLFCATALSGKTADQIMEIIEILNFKLEAINDNVPISFRPGNPLKLGFYNQIVDHHLLMLHFSYYLHVMIINRMSFKRSWLNHDENHSDDNSKILPRQKKSIAKCLDAARNILNIVQKMGVYKVSIFNVSLFVFLSSFFTLLTACLEFPNTLETKNDLELMQRIANEFFSKLKNMSKNFGDDKLVNIIDNMTKFFLRIGFLVYNNSNQDKLDITSIENDLKNYEQSLDQEHHNNHNHRKRKHNHGSTTHGLQHGQDLKNYSSTTNKSQQTAPYSPNNPSSLNNVRYGQSPNSLNSPIDSQRRSSQQNTPDLNNILNDPISSNLNGVSNEGTRNVSGSYAPSMRSTSSTTTETPSFDPFAMNNEFDISSNSNVFQQLFPIPNLFFGNSGFDDKNSNEFNGHFEW
ncbi:putative transcriptional regulatory protein [Wickerhamomyces ciferrii]|uniref:Transcriptional regulatory protein n=1 Tax=Wickerhamomyces ciferrii (strain ATCC 14091 / BCRC 22168 / CBS 111 / JCM 3599 / NBRC 0793 / NRRL Y-1031 F-60-10) TaxID=1206466 RepID=K0KPF0_WICCF|nr:putative transcriptional regulatory protein [Wickerhamomyces ciferrii]CCH44836.1 putative transcriptional regulatory protein [Wickerhamomyces ciferrii]